MEGQQEILKKNVKNVIIINDFNYIQGGASKVAIETANLLKNLGINVYFFSAVNKEEENIDGITYVTTKQSEALKNKNKLQGIIDGIYNFKAKKKLKSLLKTLDRENTIIHIHGWTKALSSSVFDIAFKMKFKVVLTMHDYFTACPNGGYFNFNNNKICTFKPMTWKCIKCNCDSRNYLYKIYRVFRQKKYNKSLKYLKNVIAISEFSYNVLSKTLSKDVKVYRVNNPIDLTFADKFKQKDRDDYYIYLGRVCKEKGVDLFCEAVEKTESAGIVVGDGPEKEFLETKYSDIKFTGWKNKEEVYEYLSKAKALIFPSRWYEGSPLTVLEALSMGIPCVVSGNCAAREYIEEGVNGYIFNNISELEYIMKNININNVSSDLLKMFSQEIYIERLVNTYTDILCK